MAPIGSSSSPDQSSSEHTTDVKPEQPKSFNDKPREAQSKTSDPASKAFQHAVSGAEKVTDPAAKDFL